MSMIDMKGAVVILQDGTRITAECPKCGSGAIKADSISIGSRGIETTGKVSCGSCGYSLAGAERIEKADLPRRK